MELSLAAGAAVPGSGPAGPRLLARLVRPGKTGWVAGGLSWSHLDNPYSVSDYDRRHLRLLRELYALHRAGSRTTGYQYGYHDEKSIDLARFSSRQLWALLDEAKEIGLQLVHARKRFGALDPVAHAALRLDVTEVTAEGSLAVTPILHIDGAPEAFPLQFIGADAHGVVYLPAAGYQAGDLADCRFGLARLAAPVSEKLRRLVLDGWRLELPAGAAERFGDQFYPLLRGLAPVVSSDGSFTPPTISDPRLVLRAGFSEGHELALDWEWAYEVGDSAVRAPLHPSGSAHPFRDLPKERAVLDLLDLPLHRFGLGDDAEGQRLAAHTELHGVDTMRFATELLPLLTDADDVTLELAGPPPRYREATDSVQIGVSTDEAPGHTDWFDLGVRITVEGREVPFAEVFVALAAGESELLLADGAYFSLLKPELQALRCLIEEARALQDVPGGPLRISRFQAGLWEELAALGVVERQAEAWRRQVSGLLALGAATTAELPVGLSATLRPYQREGFGWLAFLWRSQLGGILADDMGLGKTVQALAMICHAKQSDSGGGPFLIVAPTSVVANWVTEAARFAPGLVVAAVTDTLRRRGQSLPEVIAGADIVVTSYTLFRLDYEAYADTTWSGLILDEAQFVKNHQSKVYQCARRLPVAFKLAITGTPMENNLMELWSLLSITAPGLFPNLTRFKESYATPIEKRADAEVLGRLKRRIKPLMLRRTKDQVASDLPEKQVQVMEVELDPSHRRIYQRHLQRERQKVLGLIGDVDRNRFTILRSLTLLRRLSLHPGLVDPAEAEHGSSKIDALLDQVGKVVAGGHRALVFSQFTGFLSQVRTQLDAAGVAYCYLDGKTRNRPAVIAQFKDGAAPVFLISLKAGGFGLNLTEADYCFLLDPWWNPATEAQAVDRTHRIGQTRKVMVYRLIARDTIEEKVLALSNRKAELFSGVMDEGNAFGSALDADDIRALLAG
ncbi:MAG: DEAD/DEAH box helicase [Actinomycetota bacterium]|nr:DEAD/DEAH box helicase [Actinomycetota bacterium]